MFYLFIVVSFHNLSFHCLAFHCLSSIVYCCISSLLVFSLFCTVGSPAAARGRMVKRRVSPTDTTAASSAHTRPWSAGPTLQLLMYGATVNVVPDVVCRPHAQPRLDTRQDAASWHKPRRSACANTLSQDSTPLLMDITDYITLSQEVAHGSVSRQSCLAQRLRLCRPPTPPPRCARHD